MDFSFSDDQSMLKESVSRFFRREYDFRSAIVATDRDLRVWSELAQLGFLRAFLPDRLGGYGGGVEAMIIMEAAGRDLVLEPLASAMALTGGLIADCAPSAERDRRLEAMFDGELRLALATVEAGMRSQFAHAGISASCRFGDGRWRLNGRKIAVLGGDVADAFLVTARDADGALRIFLIPRDTPGLSLRRMRTVDGRGLAEVELTELFAPADALLDLPGRAEAALDAALDRAVAASCAEMVGAMGGVLDATVEHTKQREQYGAPLASYQALQHRMADMYVALELARSMAFLAASVVEENAETRAAAVSAAWVETLRSARFVGENGVQLHGGMGMSEEGSVAHYFKRLIQARTLWGDETFHLRRFDAIPRTA
jgi:alkylation response protein AidB-like acyl-CoA dehydrogenase